MKERGSAGGELDVDDLSTSLGELLSDQLDSVQLSWVAPVSLIDIYGRHH